jgi:hypothetical protein
MATSKTPKELAEATALAALESLQAALKKEQDLREALRTLRATEPSWSTRISDLEGSVKEAEKRLFELLCAVSP